MLIILSVSLVHRVSHKELHKDKEIKHKKPKHEHSKTKACWNRWAYSCFLKESSQATDLQSSGGAFGSVGATASKARSALSPVQGTASRTWTEDLGDPLLEWVTDTHRCLSV